MTNKAIIFPLPEDFLTVKDYVPVDTKTGLLKLLILLVKHLNWCIRKVKNFISAAPNTLHHLV